MIQKSLPTYMKTNQWSASMAAVTTICAIMSSPCRADSTSPSIPVGSLSATPTVVQTGTKPTLTWNVTYPSVVKDYVNVTPASGSTAPPPAGTTVTNTTITPKVNLIADIRVLGAGVTTTDSKGNIVYIRTVGQLKYNGASGYSTIFDGKNTDAIVQQQGIIKTINVTKDKPMYFGGYYIYNGSTSGDNVRTLVNGDTPPSNIPVYNAPSLESFLKPYLDTSGKVKIGPMDVIIFMELTHTDKNNVGYDLQDLVFLVTFRTL
jgi:hypothetical protein